VVEGIEATVLKKYLKERKKKSTFLESETPPKKSISEENEQS
jgi:hypothetical protein